MSNRRAIVKSLLAIVSFMLLAAAKSALAKPFAYITNLNSNNVSVIEFAPRTPICAEHTFSHYAFLSVNGGISSCIPFNSLAQ